MIKEVEYLQRLSIKFALRAMHHLFMITLSINQQYFLL